MDTKYEVVKFYEQEGREPKVIRRNLSREEAKRMVNQSGTSGGKSGKRWFWGFRAQDD